MDKVLKHLAPKYGILAGFLRKPALYVKKGHFGAFYWLFRVYIMQNLRFCEISLYKYREKCENASHFLKTALPSSFCKISAKSQILRKAIASRRSLKNFIFEVF